MRFKEARNQQDYNMPPLQDIVLEDERQRRGITMTYKDY
jgi:hypothetical protein